MLVYDHIKQRVGEVAADPDSKGTYIIRVKNVSILVEYTYIGNAYYTYKLRQFPRNLYVPVYLLFHCFSTFTWFTIHKKKKNSSLKKTHEICLGLDSNQVPLERKTTDLGTSPLNRFEITRFFSTYKFHDSVIFF